MSHSAGDDVKSAANHSLSQSQIGFSAGMTVSNNSIERNITKSAVGIVKSRKGSGHDLTPQHSARGAWGGVGRGVCNGSFYG